MPIQLLSPQLINQIAAGEIVERPASVVKELLENSLDAGATRLEIEIEQGGIKCIRIRDNGSGVAKSDLPLVLARHATSKIVTLDDLEKIMSLGFRGEALASISSIARLILTSKTTQQKEAWQVYVEGRDMEVTVKPAAHPVGTTVEVFDLFFNTPARRHFLKSERTEFIHIDEIVKKIALARYSIEILLKHNGKLVRHYRPVSDLTKIPQRTNTIAGKLFIDSGIRVSWQHHDLQLDGWVLGAGGSSSQLDIQYCYVNGRVIRDRLLMHAIKQAYQEVLGQSCLNYILYLTLPAEQVDVNVHPTKQEVRFHQSRLVHDFVYQAVLSALNTSDNAMAQFPLVEGAAVDSPAQSTTNGQMTHQESKNKEKWQAFRQQYQHQALSNQELQAMQSYNTSLNQLDVLAATQEVLLDGDGPSKKIGQQENSSFQVLPQSNMIPSEELTTLVGKEDRSMLLETAHLRDVDSHKEQTIQRQIPEYNTTAVDYKLLFPARDNEKILASFQNPMIDSTKLRLNEPLPNYVTDHQLGRVLTIYKEQYAIIERQQQLFILILAKAQDYWRSLQLQQQIRELKQEALLVPLAWEMSKSEHQGYLQQISYSGLHNIGIECTCHKNKISINKVPLILRRCPLQPLLSGLLTDFGDKLQITHQPLLNYLLQFLKQKKQWSQSEAIQFVAQFELDSIEYDIAAIQSFMVKIDLETTIDNINHDKY